MFGSIIKTVTSDNKEIFSVLYKKTNKQNDSIVVLVHGACMNFTSGTSLFIPYLSDSAYDFISVNTRAHDLGYISNSYKSKEGWAWQTLQHNLSDLNSVIQHLDLCGYQKIVLCGHSWGCLICLEYICKNTQNISGIILISPTISYKLLLEVNYRNSLYETINQAENLVKNDKSDEIILTDRGSPLPFMSAKTILEFYNSSFNIYDCLDKININTDIIVGGLEHKKLIEFSKNASLVNNRIKGHIINKANHFYLNHESELVKVIDSILLGEKP